MFTAWRFSAVILGLCVVLATGCDKAGTASAGGGTTSGAPNKGDDSTLSKKLVGVWEGTEDFGKGKTETITLEFKGDGGMTLAMGPFNLKGTYKVTKEDGKTVTMDTEMTIEGFGDPKAPPKSDKKAMKVVFTDDNTITMSKTEGKAEEKVFKRKK